MKPVVLLDPAPRTAAEIFTPECHKRLFTDFNVIERGNTDAAAFYTEHLPHAQFVVGQPALNADMIASTSQLRAIINVESNFLQNMDYNACFRQQIHVLTVSPVFAQPVAELALGLTLALARDIPAAHQAFADGREVYGLDGNRSARLINRCNLGFVGFGDLGRAVLRTFSGFDPHVLVHDPWLSPDVLRRDGIQSATLDEVLSESDVVQVVASVTAESTHLLGKAEFAKMRNGAMLLLLSRAEVVDFDALMAACQSGHIRAASDVYPEEPLAADHPIRNTPNFILSAHRAGALESALFEIGERTLGDMLLMTKGLPPQNCKRAEAELVGQLRSKPVDKT